jgi:Family of unknown function (DUF6056)
MINGRSKIRAWATSKSATRSTDWLLAGLLALSLIAYASLGFYSRYMADDYSGSQIVRKHGFFGAQISRYQEWSGRFSFTFFDTLLASIGPATPRFIPTLLLTLWFGASIWATYKIHRLSGSVSWARVVLWPVLIIFGTLETATNVSQSLYWQTGALTYVAPFILLSLYVGLVGQSLSAGQKRLPSLFNLAFAGILPFIAGGFSDAYVVLQSAGLILSLLSLEIFASPQSKSRIRPFLVVGLVGSLLALAIVAAAPGNIIRQTYFPKQFAGWRIWAATLRYSTGFIARLVLTNPIIFFASLFLPFLIVVRDLNHGAKHTLDRRMCLRLLLVIPATVFALVLCCTGSSVYAISVMLPERAQILLSLVVISGVVLWSRIAGEYLANVLTLSSKMRRNMSMTATILMMLLMLSPLISFFSILGMRHKARSFAADWERQDSVLKMAKENGVTDVIVPQIGDFQSRIGKGPSDLHLRTDSTFWINQRTATYYGLRSVRASDDAISR